MSNFYYSEDIPKKELVPNKNYRKILAHGGNLMLVEVEFKEGGVGDIHTHIHEQATYCVEGEFEFTVGDETKVIKKGDTIYMPSNIEHGCKLLSDYGKLIDIFTPQRDDFLE